MAEQSVINEGGGVYLTNEMMGRLWKTRATGSAWSVFACIAQHVSGIYGDAWPSIQRLAQITHLSEGAVRKGIAELKSIGILRVEARFDDRGQTSNLYTIPHPLDVVVPMQEEDEEGLHYSVGGGATAVYPNKNQYNKNVVSLQEPLLDTPGGVEKASVSRYPLKEEGLKNASTGVKQSGKDTQRDYAQKPKPAHTQLVSAYFNALESLGRVVDRSTFARHVKTAKVLADIGYTPEHVHEKTVEMGSQSFWKDKGLPIERVADALMVAPPQPLKPAKETWRVVSMDDSPFLSETMRRMDLMGDDDAN